ncbi:aminotransferase class I/II-fold pyridoxal phosphate-dependent enzyme [Tepidibacillus fermentans]|uniref:Arginine/lysine/ornithine decarboxylase n=1 Tax=Tepidibacillus fermentans TaxID=1281767 RepID=A0A4R3K5K2_9BACI|nr:aminotransferase class I/II-fold pyridoxal phosphate-dependent enzyme [Tepidibacillus fermentans]TCS77951.1 arginine/lysine/ornithine decarboxylase [Tepidibacillus fermentans]
MKKQNTYLFEQLQLHHQKRPISFHVPGHKMGKGFDPLGREFFQDILQIDLTEVSGLDDLHQPESVILDSEKRAARVFKAKATFFLVNGSTAGNLAMILATCKPGDKIIVQRNVHKSVIHGLILAKTIPIYVQPEYIPSLGIWGSVSLETIEKALMDHPEAKAVLLTNPNYYGIGVDLTEIARLVHRYRIPLLIDEAHGAHFGFHKSFPKSSIQMGADLVVQSTHKTLSAMTMGSMLHVNYDSLIDIERLKFFLSVVQTSSPSYPIMASLDLTCRLIEEKGESLWDPVLEWLQWFDEKASTLDGIQVQHLIPSQYFTDPLKRTIQSQIPKVSGFDLQRQLEESNIFTELADRWNTLAIMTYGNTLGDIKALYHSLSIIDQLYQEDLLKEGKSIPSMEFNFHQIDQEQTSTISLDQVIYGRKKVVPLKASVGMIAAEMVIPYPPGIPLIQLGERITKGMVSYLLELKEMGSKFQGVVDPTISTINVVDVS